MSKTRIGLIGCGKQAPKHISGLRSIPDTEIVLADLNPDFARSLSAREGVSCVESIEHIFLDESIAAIDICTPTPSHASLIRSALASGKDFFCEKPLAESLEEAQQLSDLVSRTSRVGMVGYIYRFAPVFELGKSLFENVPASGESSFLGRIATAHLRIGGRGSHQVWKHRREQGGGAINEMLVHMVDLAIWYFGPVEDLQVLACELLLPERVIQGAAHEVDAEDYVLVRLKMKSGLDVFCQADMVTPAFTQFIEVQGENGTFVGSIQAQMPSYLFLNQEIGEYKKGRNDLNFGPQNLFEAQMADFLKAVRSGGQPSRSTVQDSVLLMEAMNKIKQEIGA